MSDAERIGLREPCAGPARVAVEIAAGRVEVRLAGESGPETEPGRGDDDGAALPGEVRATVEHDTGGGAPPWIDGLANVLGWLDERLGDPGGVTEDRVARALAAVTLRFEDSALVVTGPTDPELRAVPLSVRVWAPDSSTLDLRAGAAPITVTGRCGAAEVATTGAVSLDDAGGRTELRCGAGSARIGRSTGTLSCSSGAGGVEVGALLGPGRITTGAGAVRIGTVSADAVVSVGSGDVTVDDASAGDLDLSTGAGSVRVGVHSGVDAKVDLRAKAGRASTALALRDHPPSGSETALRIRGRAAAGDARVQAAG